MISLTLDDHKEVGNAIWIEDVWSPEVSNLFPIELQKIILDLNKASLNEFGCISGK